MGLSQRAYASPSIALHATATLENGSRKRNAGGVSDMAVRKAIASGRITVENDGTIDPDKADRAWGSSSDFAQVRPVAKSPPPRGTPRPVPLNMAAGAQH